MSSAAIASPETAPVVQRNTLPAREPQPRRWTVADYHRMAETGLLAPDERVELIEGEIIVMSPIDSPHRTAVFRATRTLADAYGSGYYVDAQIPVTLADGTEPQPDVVVAVGSVDDYEAHHPYPSDIRLIAEVSDSTLAADRTRKAAIYASIGIPEYWIVNLTSRYLEVFLDADPALGYKRKTIFGPGETVTPQSPPRASILVSSLLPRHASNEGEAATEPVPL